MEVRDAIKTRKSDVTEEMLTPSLSIVEEDGSLGSNEDQQINAASILETSIDTPDSEEVQYEFRLDGVAYRAVQMGDAVESVTATVNSAQPVQTIYTNPINGGIYVIGSTHDVFPLAPHQKAIVPRVHEDPPSKAPVTRDDKRRATHNEVERRRRDKINNWIMKLGKIIPECKQESSKGNFESQSKGGILAKACDYIVELRESNERLLVYAKENEQLVAEVEGLSHKLEKIRAENDRLKSHLRQHGIPFP